MKYFYSRELRNWDRKRPFFSIGVYQVLSLHQDFCLIILKNRVFFRKQLLELFLSYLKVMEAHSGVSRSLNKPHRLLIPLPSLLPFSVTENLYPPHRSLPVKISFHLLCFIRKSRNKWSLPEKNWTIWMQMTQDTRKVSNTREKGKGNRSLQTGKRRNMGLYRKSRRCILGQSIIKKYKFTNKLCICISWEETC